MVGVVGSSPIAPTSFLKSAALPHFFFGRIEMPVIRLPDGSERKFDQPVTVAEVAASIGAGLARAALAGKLDGRLVDTSHRIESDAELAIVTERDAEGLEVIRHSTAHLLAQAVKTLFPEAQVTIGPVIEDGFFYDFSYKRPFTPEDLQAIEKKMAELVKADLKVERKVLSRSGAISFFKGLGEHYKAQIIESIPSEEDLSLYTQGDFTDLCRGPHVPSTARLKVFKLMKVAGAYWRGDSKNEMLTRVYGTAWAKKEDQEAYLHRLEEAEKRDHRKIGKLLDLFHTQEEAPGMVFWHPNGWTLYQAVEQYMRQVFRDNGYQEIRTPQGRSLAVDGPARNVGRERRTAVERASDHVDQPPQHRFADGHGDRPAEIQHLGPARQPAGGLHRHRAHHIVPGMLLDFENDRGFVAAWDFQGVAERRKAAGEMNIDDRPGNSDDDAFRLGGGTGHGAEAGSGWNGYSIAVNSAGERGFPCPHTAGGPPVVPASRLDRFPIDRNPVQVCLALCLSAGSACWTAAAMVAEHDPK